MELTKMQLWALKCYHVGRIHEATQPGAFQSAGFLMGIRGECDAIEKIEVEAKALEDGDA